MSESDCRVVGIDLTGCPPWKGGLPEIFGEIFDREYDSGDFRIVRRGRDLEIHLGELDMSRFRESIVRLKSIACERYDSREAVAICDLGDRILRTVSGIGSYGFRNRKRIFAGFDRERRTRNRKEKVERRGKHFYSRDHHFDRDANPLPEAFADTIRCGDSEIVLQELPDNCIDLVFTSPPYNFGLDYGGDNDSIDWESYFGKIYRILDQCTRVLRFGGRLVVNVQPLFSDYIPSHHLISAHLMSRRMIWKGEILWEKNNYNCKYTAWGSWKSPASPYLKYTWEFLEVFCKGDLKKSGDAEKADIPAESFKEWVNARWSIAPERRMKEFGHPAMFPEELARRVLLLFSFRGDVVLDPFVGVGTTCVAARKTGRTCVGIDLSEEYCKRGRERLQGTVTPSFLF